MKTNKLSTFLLFAFAVTLLNSCYRDDEEIFDQTSSARMQAALKEAKAMLVSSENGWVMDLYPESTQAYGGWAYTVRFDEEFVYAASELAKTSDEVKSTYKLTNDDGPVLTFDGYNSLLHYFATPTQSNYQAFKGEFEFIVMKVEQDLITLRGKKTANTIYLHRLTEPAKDYIDKVSDMSDRLILSGFKGNVNGKEIHTVADLDYRQLDFYEGEDYLSTVAFCVTPNGIRLYQDYDVAGTTLNTFDIAFDEVNNVPSTISSGNVQMTAVFPDGWRKYTDYVGKFIWKSFELSSAAEVSEKEIEILSDEDGSTLWLRGLINKIDIKLVYNKAQGIANMSTQLFFDQEDHTQLAKATVNGKSYYLATCAFSLAKGASSGSISYSTSTGFSTKFVGENDDDIKFEWVDNGKWSGDKARCSRIYCFSSTSLSSSSRQSSVSVPNDYRYQVGNYYSTTLYWPESITKVQ